MTREEAIEHGKEQLDVFGGEHREFIEIALKALEQTGWIPVKSGKLPKYGERILVTRKMFHWANEPAEYLVGIVSFDGCMDAVAWMPLPTPYKAESEVQG